MQKVEIRVRYLILILSFLSSCVIADDWSVKYEKPKCHSNDDPKGDVNLVCSESETVKKLEVSLSKESLGQDNYSGKIKVTNTNNYPVLVKTILVDALDSTDQVIGFCSNNINQSLYPNDSFAVKVGCKFQAVLPENENKIVAVKVRATPWK